MTIIYGEDVGKPGGIFGMTRNLQKDFGPERVFGTPISENAILGSAVGAAISGLKPIVQFKGVGTERKSPCISGSCAVGANLSVHRLATPSVRIPASPVLRAALLPNSDSIARAVRGLLNAD